MFSFIGRTDQLGHLNEFVDLTTSKEKNLFMEIVYFIILTFLGLLLAFTGRRYRPFYNAFCGFLGFQIFVSRALLCWGNGDAWKMIAASVLGVVGALLASFLPKVAHYSLAVTAGLMLAGFILHGYPMHHLTFTTVSRMILDFLAQAILITIAVAYAFFKENGAAWIFSGLVGSSLALLIFRFLSLGPRLGYWAEKAIFLSCFMVIFFVSLLAQRHLCPELTGKKLNDVL